MNRYITGLGDTMRDRKRFDSLPNEIKEAVYGFLKHNREIRRVKNQIEKEREIFNNKIAPLLKLLNDAKENEADYYKIVKELPNRFYTLSGLYVDKQKDRRGYFLDIRYCGRKRKVAIGNTLSQIENKLKIVDKDFKTKVKFKNYKSVIPSQLRYVVNDFILKNGWEKFNDEDFHIKWDDKGKFKYEKVKVSKGVYKNKKDRWDNTPRSTSKKPTTNKNSISTDW